jgi:hypothetical protein
MGNVFTGASMSLDGYISGPAETGFERLFKWYGNGDGAPEFPWEFPAQIAGPAGGAPGPRPVWPAAAGRAKRAHTSRTTRDGRQRFT